MVQLFYYENQGKNCRKILNHEGRPTKIFLYPDESYVKNGLRKHWILKTAWWNRNCCRILEYVSGRKQRETKGHIINHPASGVMYIIGKFKNDTENPDFCMKLSSSISKEDLLAGYSMTGMRSLSERT